MTLPVENCHNYVDDVVYKFFLDVTLLHWIFGTRFKCLHILGQNCFCEFQYSGPNWFSKKFLIFQVQSQPPESSLGKPNIKHCKTSRQFELDIGPAIIKFHVVFKMRAKCCTETSAPNTQWGSVTSQKNWYLKRKAYNILAQTPETNGHIADLSVLWRIILKWFKKEVCIYGLKSFASGYGSVRIKYIFPPPPRILFVNTRRNKNS